MVTLPKEVDIIENEAFVGNEYLTHVIFEGTTPPTKIGTLIFKNCYPLNEIYVPEGSEDAYKTALPDYADMIKITSKDVLVNTADELKTALESITPSVINVTADIEFTEMIKQGADHTLIIPRGKTVTGLDDDGFINICDHTLTINGGGTFACNRNGNALYSREGTLKLENITVNVIGKYGGINVKTVNVDVGATVNLNSDTAKRMIYISDASYTLNINTGGTVNVANFGNDAVYNSGSINVDGGTLTLGEGNNSKTSIMNQSDGTFKISNNGILNGTNGGGIELSEGSYVAGVSGKFSDMGIPLTNNGIITVGAYDAAISENGLSEGFYVWSGSTFGKNIITASAKSQYLLVTQGAITESLSVIASASNNESISYLWLKYNEAGKVTEISGANDAAYTLPTDLTVGTYKYECVIAAPGCETYTIDSIMVKVNPAVGAPTYAVTVNGGTAIPSTVAAGVEVVIIANAPVSGKRFKEWTVDSGGAILSYEQDTSTDFIMPAEPVEITATYEDLPTSNYAITIQSDGNGINEACDNDLKSVTSAEQNKQIIIRGFPQIGYSFKEWQVVSGDVELADVDDADNGFTMPASDVVLKAIFKPIPVNYTVTFDLNGGTRTGGGALTQIVANGGSATVPTVTRSGYTLSGWDKASTNVTASLKVTAIWSRNGSSGGSSSGGGSAVNKATIKENQPNKPVTAIASVTATKGTDGTASVSIPDKAVTDAIAKAKAEATKQGKTEKGISVGLEVTMPKGAKTLTATLSHDVLNSLVSGGVTQLTIDGAPVNITFDQKVLAQIQKQSNGSVKIEISPKAELSEMARAIIGTRPAYNITISYGTDSTVSSFGGNTVGISIPYTPARDEAVNGLYAVYVDEKGNATPVEGSAYDPVSGCIVFTTPHLSIYGVGYTATSEKYTDIKSHWAKESIDYLVDKGMIDGVTETTFAPDAAMLRGTLVTALGRLAGEDVSGYTTSSFTDVEVGSKFQPYIEWAYHKGIIHGIGDNQFAPDRAINREEIAVIIANFTNATGYTLPVNGKSTAYGDDSSIGNHYKPAVTAMQQAGIMTGDTKGNFNPKSNATRAEVSSMLYRYIKLITE